MSVYEALVSAGQDIDHHESDLYVRATPLALTILKRDSKVWASVKAFTSDIDGKLWYDVPFAYDPYWVGRSEARPA